MKIGFLVFVAVALLAFLCSPNAVYGIRFVIDREECFSHDVKYEGDTIHVSFVVIKADSTWHNSHEGVDLVVSFLFSLLRLIWFRHCHSCLMLQLLACSSVSYLGHS